MDLRLSEVVPQLTQQQVAQPPEAAKQVPLQNGAKAVGVPGLDGLEELFVLLVDLGVGDVSEVDDVQHTKPGVVLVGPLDTVPKIPLVGGGEPGLVELAVQLVKAAGLKGVLLDGVRHLPAEELELLQQQLVAHIAEIRQHEGLHGHPLIDDLVDDIQIHAGDIGAAVGLDGHQPAQAQFLEHTADGGAGHKRPRVTNLYPLLTRKRKKTEIYWNLKEEPIMKMKKFAALTLALALGASLTACGGKTQPSAAPAPSAAADAATTPAAEPAKSVSIVLAHFGAANEPVTSAAETFKAKVEELSKGTMTVEIHGNSELGDAKEMAEQTTMNAIQACLVSQGTLDKYDIRYALVTAPYVYDSYEHAYAVVDGPFAEWVGDGVLESKGLHNVGAWDYGFRNLTNSKREVVHPADVAGLTIRTPSEVQKVACFEALGANVQQVAFSELITALKQNTVDGQENPISTIYNNAMWEANQKYLSLTHHTWEAVNLTVNNKFWEGLTDEQRDIIQQASNAARDQMRAEVQNSETEYAEKLRQEGVTVTEVDVSEFKEAMQPAWDTVAEYEGSADDMQKFLDMVADCAK